LAFNMNAQNKFKTTKNLYFIKLFYKN